MASYTPYYELTKPGPDDLVDIGELNENFDAIDLAIHNAAQSGGTATGMIETSTEASATAAHAYAVGEHFIYHDILYKATAAIAVGDTIAAGTNCQAVTVAGELENVQESLVFDDTPTEGSDNPVKSGGIYDALALKLDASQKGAANGLATLNGSGQVPAEQLPSYIDNVVEGYYYNGAFYEDQAHTQLITGESGKIYVDLSTEETYRWSGSMYIKISSTLELGETHSTAYYGDRGKAAYDHSLLTTGNPHNVTKSEVGLGNVDNTSDANKPVSTAQQAALNAKASIDDVQAGTEAKKAYHMGFYLDSDGDLCQA